MAFLTLGLWLLLVRPKPVLVVTYRLKAQRQPV